METGLAGKVAVITGGAGAIGRACAHALAREGATVVLSDLDPGAVEAAAEQVRPLGVPALGLAADITREDDVAALARRVVEAFGHWDVLVNCAGIFQAVPIEDLPPADWRCMLDVNLTGLFLCGQQAMRVMRAQGGGRIINIGSLAGQVGGLAAGANYAVSKAGVICLTKSMARALGGSGVTVNTINPGPIESPMVDAWPPGQREIQLKNIPVGRLGQPDDVAHAVVFLASVGASYIHGAHLDVNGGLLMD